MLEGIGMSLPVDKNSSQPLAKPDSGKNQKSQEDLESSESFVNQLKGHLKKAKKSATEAQPNKDKSLSASSRKTESSQPFSETEMMAAFATVGPPVGTREDPLELEERAFQDPVSEELKVLRARNDHRKDAMLKFMDSMESDLGISPQQMIEAIRSSGTDKVQGAPEQSMAKVLARLDLEPRQIEKAADLYAEMLVDSGYGSKALNREQRDFSDSKFNILTRGQVRRHEQSASVDRLQNQFFDTGIANRPQANAQGAKTAPDLVSPQNFFQTNSLQEVEEGASAVNSAAETYQRPKQSSDSSSLLASLAMMKAATKSESQPMAREMNFSPSQQGLENSSTGKSAVSGFENMMANSQFGDSSSQQSFSSNGFESQSTDMARALSNDSGDEMAEAGFDDLVMTRSENVNLAQSKADPVAGAKVSMFNGNSMNAEIENMQEVMDRAQVMIKDGGGAMRVKLNPEGLGEVDLNVDVENGQVNIRMVTEHSEAKRALEKGLEDLKGQLALQKLNVDTVKIDISGELAKHFEEDQSEAEQDQAREFARDFMGRNREESQFSRQGFLGTPFQKYFSQQRGDVDPVHVEEAQASAQTSSKSSQLHLVA